MATTLPTAPSSAAAAPPVAAVRGRPTRVALVGAGFIADVHMQVLRGQRAVLVAAVCDPQRQRAERFATKHGIAAVFSTLDAMLAAGGLDAVHVLTPPTTHAEVATACLRAGLHVLVEKPLVLRAGEVGPLRELAERQGRLLATNHNQTFHPAVQALRSRIDERCLGRLEHVTVQHHVPLRQLQSGDVGHFMFQTEANILLEQGVHLFSIVHALLGPARSVQAVTGARRELPNGVAFVEEWVVRIDCERGSACVRMAFGKTWPETTVQAVGTDGSALLDLQRGSCQVRRKTRWLDFLDSAANLAGGSLHLAGCALDTLVGYGLGLFGLAFPADPFLRGMRGSIAAFHAAVRGSRLADSLGPAAAHAVLTTCALTAEAAGAAQAPPPAPRPLPEPGPARAGEVVVLGGTGFLGRRCVRRLRELGRPVTLIARRPQLLPAALRDGAVRVFAGDAADPAVLAAAFAGASCVLHLATAAGDDPAAVERAMAAAVRAAGEAALAAKVGRLVYTSSTAALWLGRAGSIDGNAGPDPQPATRAAYARGKIAAEKALAALREKGLPVVVVRPAIVVGDDGIAEHGGVGMWVRDNHCVGWGLGSRPLPLVLADDCAQALVAALDAPDAPGKGYNLAGDVRLSAREYVAELARATGRDYRFHPTPLRWMWVQELGKYLVKALARRPREWPAYRDLASRSFRTVLDCSDAKRDLGFRPETDRARFLERAFGRAAR